MKSLYWLGIAFFLMLPSNYVILSMAKIVYGQSFGREDVVGAAVGVFGLCVAVMLLKAKAKRQVPK